MLLAPKLYAEEPGLPPPAAGVVDAGMTGRAESDEQSFPRHSGPPVVDVEALGFPWAATNPAAMVVAGEDARPQAGEAPLVPPLPRVAGETKTGFDPPAAAAGTAKEGALAWDYIRRIEGGGGRHERFQVVGRIAH
jgi:hypothetical protein